MGDIKTQMDLTPHFMVVVRRILREQTLIVIFVFIIIGMALSTPVFLTPRNLMNILQQTSMIGVTAAGMTMLILMADIDLSVGSVAAFAGMFMAKLQVFMHWNSFGAIALPLMICFGIGLAVGVVVTKLGVHSFVATLGVLSIARGFALIISEGHPITNLRPSIQYIGQGMVGPVAFPVIIMLSITLITWFFLSQTRSGRAIYSIGGNMEAARLSGIPVDRIRIMIFGTCSVLAGLSGIILAGRVNAAVPVASESLNLDVIASVIIGGTSLFGGRGGIWKTLVGTLILGILRNGLNLLNVTPYWQQVFIGFLIVLTVVLDRIQHRDEA